MANVELFLEHYGIKGMRWGVINEDNLSRSERKAQKFDQKAKDLQKQLDNFSGSNREKRQIRNERDKALDNAKRKRDGKLSSGEKKVAIAATLIAAKLAYNSIQSGQARTLALKGREFLGKKGLNVWKKNPALALKDLDADTIMSEVVSKINPDYGQLGTKMNCRRCTFAYELRRRGYDVAATRTTNGRGQNISGLYNALHPDDADIVGHNRSQIFYKIGKSAVKNDKRFLTDLGSMAEDGGLSKKAISGANKYEQLHRLFSDLAQHPTGARGELGIEYSVGGGHSIAWEIIKGKTVLFDTQSGRKYSNIDQFVKDFGATTQKLSYTRLDDIPLDLEFLQRWIKNAA